MYPFKESQIYTSFQYLRTMLFGVPRTKKAAAVIWCRTIRAVLRKTAACGRFMFACGLTYVYFNVFAKHFFCHLLPSEVSAADSQMTTSFFMLQSWMLDSEE
jgi:hypothetical protein